MPQIRVGYRQLFIAHGWSPPQEERRIGFLFGEERIQVNVNIGSKPAFTFMTMGEQQPKYAARGGSLVFKPEFYQDTNKTKYAGSSFTEIIYSTAIEVTAEILDAFYRDDTATRQHLLDLARERENSFRLIADVIDGIIGLKFHRQLILDLINENIIAFDDKKFISEAYSNSIEMLDPIHLHEQDMRQMNQILWTEGEKKDEALQVRAIILGWLRDAWIETDITNKFISFFIPIEMILRDYGGTEEKKKELRLQAKTIRKLIRIHGGEQKQQLVKFLDSLVERQRPTLEERFENLARKANIPGWKYDVEAFGLFNKMRNELIHRGSPVQLSIKLSNGRAWSLEEIAERYVNYVLFKDMQLYPSRYRSNRDTALDQTTEEQE